MSKANRLAILWGFAASVVALAGAGLAGAADAPADVAPKPTSAADADAAAKAKAKAEADAAAKKAAAIAPIEQIVITGSHIHKDEYSSASPIQVIKKDESVLAGLTTTTEVLQGSTVTGGSNQINNYFGGYVTDGGPGANTLSLRGLGAVRTLILLNGRRLAPSGTRGSVGSADLNVLPTAMVDRIEILKDGASSVYGSDAVAGVVNIITRKGIKDWTFEATRVNTDEGGGDVTKLSVVGGHTWDRFDISGSFEFDDRQELTVGQRNWASCPTQALIDPVTGQYAAGSILDPSGQPRCFPVGGLTGTGGLAHDYIIAPTAAGVRWTPNPLQMGGALPGWDRVDSLSLRPDFDPSLLKESLISPTRNYTGFVNGSYDLHALGNGELYFEALYARRESKQTGARQLSLDYQYDNGFNFDPNPLVPQVIYNNTVAAVAINPRGDFVEARAFVAWGNDHSSQKVDFDRLVVGLRGDLSFLKDWKYDAYVVANHSDASYTFQSFLTDRIYNSTYVVPVAGPTTAPTRTVNGVTYTCASNIGNPNPDCVPAPYLDSLFLSGQVDQAYRDYVFRPVTGNTAYDETTVNATFDGSLFKLPAGEMRAAVGVEFRHLKLDDTPGPDMVNGNLYNFTSAGITRGTDTVREAFAEVETPILRGLPGAEDLTFNLSGRLTDYKSYGSDHTYKAGLQYTPVKWLKLRGTKGTSFRAPALFEQYLAPTSGFLSSSVDPCDGYGSLPPTSVRYVNCDSELHDPTFIAHNGVQVNSAGGAALGLKSEKSKADTVGIVVQPGFPASVGDMAFAIDWWRIDVENQVAQIGAPNLLSLCYDDPQFRAGGSYCAYSARDVNGTLLVQDNYINIAAQLAEGVDYNVRYARSVGVGEFVADLRATRYLRQDSKLLPTDPLDKLNGTLQSPKWVGDADLRYTYKDCTFRYGLTYVGPMDSNALVGVDPSVDPFDFTVDSYVTHDFSVKYTSPSKWSLIVGVRNATNTVPQTVSPGAYDRVGNSLLYSAYDYFGRRYFVTLSETY
ncbi:MAG TPA: TonB-dependent receptor [Steroidobacteraceae bacterium]|nr:TonB-dependent receptor [Steroidobacteraceae bacterium]